MAGNSSRNAYEHSTEDNHFINSQLAGFDVFPRQHWAYSSSQTIVSAESLHQEELNQEQDSLATDVLESNEVNITAGGLSGPVLLAVDSGTILSNSTVPISEVRQSLSVLTIASSHEPVEAPFFADFRPTNVSSTSRNNQATNTSSQLGDQGQQSTHEEAAAILATTASASRIDSTRTEVSPSADPSVAYGFQVSPINRANLLASTKKLQELRPLIQEEKETAVRPALSRCERHKEDFRYLCHSCQMSICENCWELDHKDITRHQVMLFKFKLNQQYEIYDRIREHEEQTTVIKQIVTQLNNVLKNMQDLKEKQKEMMKSTNNEELMKRAHVVKEVVEVQMNTVDSLQRELPEQFMVVKTGLEDLLTPGIDKHLKDEAKGEIYVGKNEQRSRTLLTQSSAQKRRHLESMNRKLMCEEAVWCTQAVYSSNRQEIICFDTLPGVLQILSLRSEINSLVLKRTVKWEEVRRDKWSKLWSIAITKENTLYACINKEKVMKWRVSVLRWNDLGEEREIDTSVIAEKIIDGYWWQLFECDNQLAIVTRLHRNSSRVYRWECAYIYNGEICTYRVRIDILCEQFLHGVCYTGSHLIMQTSRVSLAVVLLKGFHSTERNRKNSWNRRSAHNEHRQPEKSRASDIKHIVLQDTELLSGLVWVARDEKELGGEGYLLVSDYNDKKCSVYELDLDRVKKSEKVTARKDLEMGKMFPECMIDNSTLFAMQGKPLEGKASISELEFN